MIKKFKKIISSLYCLPLKNTISEHTLFIRPINIYPPSIPLQLTIKVKQPIIQTLTYIQIPFSTDSITSHLVIDLSLIREARDIVYLLWYDFSEGNCYVGVYHYLLEVEWSQLFPVFKNGGRYVLGFAVVYFLELYFGYLDELTVVLANYLL